MLAGVLSKWKADFGMSIYDSISNRPGRRCHKFVEYVRFHLCPRNLGNWHLIEFNVIAVKTIGYRHRSQSHAKAATYRRRFQATYDITANVLFFSSVRWISWSVFFFVCCYFLCRGRRPILLCDFNKYFVSAALFLWLLLLCVCVALFSSETNLLFSPPSIIPSINPSIHSHGCARRHAITIILYEFQIRFTPVESIIESNEKFR